jgi:hypothetical protein
LGNPLVSAQDANDSPTLLEAEVQFHGMEHVFCSPVQDGAVKSKENGYGSIPINTIFTGMNIHLTAILIFTRGTRF